jgi:hypothetical protein
MGFLRNELVEFVIESANISQLILSAVLSRQWDQDLSTEANQFYQPSCRAGGTKICLLFLERIVGRTYNKLTIPLKEI